MEQAPIYEDFSEALSSQAHTPVPDSWSVVICDVENSTSAIRAGNYKAVNLIGAAAMMAVHNLTGKPNEIPAFFGGDGASFLVPPTLVQAVIQTLARCRTMAHEQFNLRLRLGNIAVGQLRQAGHDLRFAWVRMSPHLLQPIVSGSGLQMAETWLKDRETGKRFQVTHIPVDTDADYAGLECRWEPLASRRGHIISLIVSCENTDVQKRNAVYRDLIRKIEAIYPETSPVTSSQLSFSRRLRTFRAESKIVNFHQSPWKRLCSATYHMALTFLFAVLWRTFLKKEGEKYQSELIANSDFKKFDGTLRMILDSSPEQTKLLETILEKTRTLSAINYGMHQSESALMTCLIFNRKSGEHLHLIDGSEGGLTEAARLLKSQTSPASKLTA